jgi:hypothetical protein
MNELEKHAIDLNKPFPDISKKLINYLNLEFGFDKIRSPRKNDSQIKGSYPNLQYSHYHTHIPWVESPIEDLLFLNNLQLPYLKALQNLARNLLKEINPDKVITVENINKAKKWYNIQILIIEMIQFLEGFGENYRGDNIKNEMLQKIFDRNLGDLIYVADDWVSLIERSRYDPNDGNKLISITPSDYKRWILCGSIGYKELDKDQYISFDVLELYKKQTPINFDYMVKIAEKTCKVRREVREKYKPDSN